MIEMIIVIAILSLVAGLMGYNVMGAVRQQRFQADVGIVVDQLRLAQDLMLIMPGDFHVKLEKNQQGFRSWIETDASLSEGWTKELIRVQHQLTAVQYAEFEDLPPDEKKPDTITINFLSGGSAMSKGLLRLSASSTGKGALARTICLYGYPHPIISSEDSEGEISCANKETGLYDDQLTYDTMEEINFVDENYGQRKNGKKS